MSRKRTYRTEGVEQLRLVELLPLLVSGCIVALDVAKAKFVVALATAAGEVVKLFRFEHPTETWRFFSVVEELQKAIGRELVRVAMEPTGTYGDAIRHRLVGVGVPVHMVSPKKSHDCREVFDGVPSLHDPKSATLIAQLCGMGLSRAWSQGSETRAKLRALIDLRGHELDLRERCLGRLEGLLARHWPEFSQWLDLREQKSASRLLAEFRSPARVRDEPARTKAFLEMTSRGRLSAEAMDGVIRGASTTLGMPMLEEEERLVGSLAASVYDASERVDQLDEDISRVGADDETFKRLAPWMGAYTTGVIVSRCDPLQYSSARQFEKACGLNLREKSSGEFNGRLHITKRGPGVVRQVLFLFALRTILTSKITHAWYVARRGYSEDSKKRAVVAVMRKLVKAIFHVARGSAFDESKLFDVRRLDLTKSSPKPPTKPEPRTKPRSIARGTKRGGARASAST